MRKIIGIIVLVLSLMMGVYLTCFADHAVPYMQCIIKEGEYEQIILSREEDKSLLEGIKFDGEMLFWDKSANTFYYSLVEGSSRAFNPDVEIFSEYGDAQIAFLDNQLTEEMIEKNQTTAILVYTQRFYCSYDLVCTTLPLMNINCVEGVDDEYRPMTITVFDNRRGAANRVVVSDGNIRIRGGSSRKYPKKGFRLQLTYESMGGDIRGNMLSLLGMRQDDDWILYAGYNDQEKVRNVLSSNLWMYSCASDNEMHIDAGMEYRYLELFINEEYWGLYALGYPIDKKQLGFGKDVEKEALYKTISWVSEWGHTEQNGTMTGYEQKDVEIDKEEGWSLIRKYYNNLYSNSEDNDKLIEWIDFDNLIDVYLFINLIQGTDHAGKFENDQIYNMYLAITTDRFGTPKCLYIPWDMDRTWGNSFGDIPYGIETDVHVVMESGYLKQIMSNGGTDVWGKICDKYWKLRNDAWSDEAINCFIDECESDIFDSGAFIRDMNRWPEGLYNNPADKLNTFRKYVIERLKKMDEFILLGN